MYLPTGRGRRGRAVPSTDGKKEQATKVKLKLVLELELELEAKVAKWSRWWTRQAMSCRSQSRSHLSRFTFGGSAGFVDAMLVDSLAPWAVEQTIGVG